MPSRRSKTTKTFHPQYPVPDPTPQNDKTIHPKSRPSATLTKSPPIDSPTPTPGPPPNWPSPLPYLTRPIISPYLPPSHLKWLRTRPQPPDEELPVIVLPASPSVVLSRVEIRVIEDTGHPACGQRGLFAARDLAPGELVVGYLGFVHGQTGVERGELRRREGERGRGVDGEGDGIKHDGDGGDVDVDSGVDTRSSNETSRTPKIGNASPSISTDTSTTNTSLIGTWDTSSYDLNMYRTEEIEVAVDASIMGNEARFVNDYRGVPVQRRELDGNGSVASEVERRKGKRRVKGWEDGSGYGGETEVQHSDARNGQWSTGGYNNGFEIAMPNAEFRDVWFDIPGDIELTPDVSVSSHDQHPHEDRKVNDLKTVLKDVHLDEALRNIDTVTNQDKEPIVVDTQDRSKTRPRRKKKNGIRGVAVFVMPAGKSGKRKGGIKKGQEVLVSYGKGFWAHHGLESGEG